MASLLKPFPKDPVFSKEELLRLANIFDNAGQVFLGGMVLAPIASIDGNTGIVIVLGMIATIVFWFLSIYLTRKAQSV